MGFRWQLVMTMLPKTPSCTAFDSRFLLPVPRAQVQKIVPFEVGFAICEAVWANLHQRSSS